MKRALIVLIAVLGLVVASPAMADTKTVQITRSAFSPAKLTVTAGDTVTWRNVDTRTHQVVANDGSFASLPLKTNETFSQTFTTSGTVRYHDANSAAVGSVVVATAAAPAPTLTLNASRTSVIYNGAVVLSGDVSTGRAGETVALNAQQAGDVKVAQAVQTTQTGPGGAFTFTVHPTIRTSYQAAVTTAVSQQVTVFVAPRGTLTRSANGTFHTTVISDLSYKGHFVLVQQRRGLGGAWTTVRKVFLGGNDSASFRMRFKPGRTFVRVWLTAGQAGFGYIAGHSGAWLVRR